MTPLPNPNKCAVCRKDCCPPAPACNYCGQPICYDCRTSRTSRPGHIHEPGTKFKVMFCFPCVKIRPVRYKRGVPRCKTCDNETSPHVARDQTNPGYVICPFCAARQAQPLLPAQCKRCRMTLT